jgi:hypothetical protein
MQYLQRLLLTVRSHRHLLTHLITELVVLATCVPLQFTYSAIPQEGTNPDISRHSIF